MTRFDLLHQTDFEFKFALPSQLLYTNMKHIIKYMPEEGEDILRLKVDNNIRILLFKEDDVTSASSLDDVKPLG